MISFKYCVKEDSSRCCVVSSAEVLSCLLRVCAVQIELSIRDDSWLIALHNFISTCCSLSWVCLLGLTSEFVRPVLPARGCFVADAAVPPDCPALELPDKDVLIQVS